MDAPIVKATLQAAFLSGLSNILAQGITCYRSNPHLRISNNVPALLNTFLGTIDPIAVFHFAFFSLLSCPPNYLWQSWLEGQFPGYATSLPPLEKEALVDDATTGSNTGTDSNSNASKRGKSTGGAMTEKTTPSSPTQIVTKAKKTLNLRNTAIKFSLDQTLGAAANTILFIAGIALLRGHSLDSIYSDLQTKFWPMIFAGQKLWPMVSVMQFTVVPFEYRTLVGSFVGLLWGVYLSLVSGGK
ncbi:hypothetical protein LTR62_001741 [Meristemomyces frigidus]|uniref:Integral membrane protein, Mpv17/PMP22 family n=1 Tax=Meristemomyces frigidus TaxID=1508187 RepID=A0AAN7TLB2_9PEZI|nr:hypothetical protein LTR62_001741 [Meristemomyces frigidus]